MTPSDPPRGLPIVRGRDIGGTVVRRRSGVSASFMVNGHHARLLGLRLAARPWVLVEWMTRSEWDDEEVH